MMSVEMVQLRRACTCIQVCAQENEPLRAMMRDEVRKSVECEKLPIHTTKSGRIALKLPPPEQNVSPTKGIVDCLNVLIRLVDWSEAFEALSKEAPSANQSLRLLTEGYSEHDANTKPIARFALSIIRKEVLARLKVEGSDPKEAFDHVLSALVALDLEEEAARAIGQGKSVVEAMKVATTNARDLYDGWKPWFFTAAFLSIDVAYSRYSECVDRFLTIKGF